MRQGEGSPTLAVTKMWKTTKAPSKLESGIITGDIKCLFISHKMFVYKPSLEIQRLLEFSLSFIFQAGEPMFRKNKACSWVRWSWEAVFSLGDISTCWRFRIWLQRTWKRLPQLTVFSLGDELFKHKIVLLFFGGLPLEGVLGFKLIYTRAWALKKNP